MIVICQEKSQTSMTATVVFDDAAFENFLGIYGRRRMSGLNAIEGSAEVKGGSRFYQRRRVLLTRC